MGPPDHTPEELISAVLALALAGDWDAADALADPADEPPDGAEVTEAIGPPPHPGLVFDRAKHRWVQPNKGAPDQPTPSPGLHGAVSDALATYRRRAMKAVADPESARRAATVFGNTTRDAYRASYAKAKSAVRADMGDSALSSPEWAEVRAAFDVALTKATDAARTVAAAAGEPEPVRATKAELDGLAADLGARHERIARGLAALVKAHATDAMRASGVTLGRYFEGRPPDDAEVAP